MKIHNPPRAFGIHLLAMFLIAFFIAPFIAPTDRPTPGADPVPWYLQAGQILAIYGLPLALALVDNRRRGVWGTAAKGGPEPITRPEISPSGRGGLGGRGEWSGARPGRGLPCTK